MTKTFIAASTALAIALGAVTATAPAQAAPLGLSAAPQIRATTSVETVGNRNGAAVAVGAVIGLGALALGAAAASQGPRHGGYRPVHRPRRQRDCYVERSERWSHRRQAYVIVKEKVCY